MLGDLIYLENIREYVEDHKVIVTYKWLSRELGVPVNAAKQMLYAYVKQDPSVSVTYMISGLVTSSEEKNYEIHLVKDTELETMKEQFQEVLGVHIFSVQKMQLKDSDSLFAANYDTCIKNIDKYSRWSPIECPIRPTSHPVPVTMVPSTEPKKTLTTPTFPALSIQHEDTTTTSTSCSSTISQTATKSTARKVPAKKKSRKPFFSSTVKKGKSEEEEVPVTVAKEEEVVKEEEVPEAKVEEVPVAKEEKVPVVEEEPQVKEPADVTPVTTSPRNTSQSSHSSVHEKQKSTHRTLQFLEDSDIDDGESDEEPVKPPTSSDRQTKKTKQAKGGKRVASERDTKKGVQGGAKKRKRVQELSSDEERESAQQELPTKRSRKRIKKLVSKMHVNEDGEMVTEKVWETDSSSDVSGGEADCGEAGKSKEMAVHSSPSPAKARIKQEKKKQASLLKFAKKKQ